MIALLGGYLSWQQEQQVYIERSINKKDGMYGDSRLSLSKQKDGA
jgi:hypothetical protein